MTQQIQTIQTRATTLRGIIQTIFARLVAAILARLTTGGQQAALVNNPASSGDVTVEISWPIHLKTTSAHFPNLSASATRGSQNISSEISWHSDIDGPLGQGALVSRPLTVGRHVISAEVIDSGRTTNATSTVRAFVTACADPHTYAGGDTCP